MDSIPNVTAEQVQIHGQGKEVGSQAWRLIDASSTLCFMCRDCGNRWENTRCGAPFEGSFKAGMCKACFFCFFYSDARMAETVSAVRRGDFVPLSLMLPRCLFVTQQRFSVRSIPRYAYRKLVAPKPKSCSLAALMYTVVLKTQVGRVLHSFDAVSCCLRDPVFPVPATLRSTSD